MSTVVMSRSIRRSNKQSPPFLYKKREGFMGSLQILLLRAYLVSPFYLTPMLEITKAVKFWIPYLPLFLFSYLREFLSFKEPFFRPPKLAVNQEDCFFLLLTLRFPAIYPVYYYAFPNIFSRAFSHTKNGPSSPSLVWEGSDGEFFVYSNFPFLSPFLFTGDAPLDTGGIS